MTGPDETWPRPVELRDGTGIEVRPISPDDKGALKEGLEALSPLSRYHRFFSPVARLSERDLAYLTEVDHGDHEAIVAFSLDDLHEPVGVARYVREAPGSDRAEVAVTVVDHWHGRGVATILLDLLSRRAREEGIRCFTARVLGENESAIELMRRLGDLQDQHWEDGSLELVLDISEGEPEPVPVESGAPALVPSLAGALRAAARGDIEVEPLRILRRRLGALRRGD